VGKKNQLIIFLGTVAMWLGRILELLGVGMCVLTMRVLLNSGCRLKSTVCLNILSAAMQWALWLSRSGETRKWYLYYGRLSNY
jgi:hypothetical protein